MPHIAVGHISADQGAGNGTGVSSVGAEKPNVCFDSCRGAFLQKSLVLIAYYEQMCSEAAKIAHGDAAVLKLGYLCSYNNLEVHQALEKFSAKYPGISVQLLYCNHNHEELFTLLRTGGADLVLNN